MIYHPVMAYAENTRIIQCLPQPAVSATQSALGYFTSIAGPSNEQIHPSRSDVMAQRHSSDPLFGAPPPVTKSNKKTGSNDIPLGPRKNSQQNFVMSDRPPSISHQPEQSYNWDFGSGQPLPTSHSFSRPSGQRGVRQHAFRSCC